MQKCIIGIADSVKDLKKTTVVWPYSCEMSRKAHADNLLLASTLSGVTIKASPHFILNSSKGVIHIRDLDDCNDDEITQELKPQRVLSVRRIVKICLFVVVLRPSNI